MELKQKDLWVGKRIAKSGGGVYVYDYLMEGSNLDTIYLFDTYRESMQQFRRQGLREAFSTVKDIRLIESSIFLYTNWLLNFGANFASIHHMLATPEYVKVHAQKLSEQYLKSKRSTNYASVRSAKCHLCHNGINNKSGIECEKCHWIICNRCGACGCNISTRDS